MRRYLPGFLVALALSTGCKECTGELQKLTSNAVLVPSVYSFGVVQVGASCDGTIKVRNEGQAELTITGVSYSDDNSGGALSVVSFPTESVLSAGEGEIVLRYAPTAPSNGLTSATLRVNTNDPTGGGERRGTVTGEAVAQTAGKLWPTCKVNLDDTGDPGLCTLMEFGSTPKLQPGAAGGLTRTITVSNDGTAPFNILGVNVLPPDGQTLQPEFAVDLINGQPPGAAVSVPASRQGACGEAIPNVPGIPVVIKFTPTRIGIQGARIQIITDAPTAGTGDGNPPAGQANVNVTGLGSGTGLGLSPEFIAFGEVAAGSSKTEDVRVANLGDSQAAVNTTCIDMNDNGTCYTDPLCTSGCQADTADVECTGGDADPSTGLNCDVEGQGKGFVLTATDATSGGTDEAVLHVTWAPPSAATFSKSLLFMSNVAGNTIYSVRITGGVAGTISANPGSVVVAASDDTNTATGSATFVVSNTGQADLVISQVSFDGPASITDDFRLTRAEDGLFTMSCTRTAAQTSCTVPAWSTPFTIAQGGQTTFTLAFQDNDAAVSMQDMDIAFTHNGNGGNPFLVGVSVCKPAGGTSPRPTCP
ncbi:MAG: choice-of-anchor D domain-containing protein [Deltaproteobacteria bacterium]|nr:choice-of-anchor D domain-containing protein [Deltaproteobacteria bacterium]